MHVNQMDPWVSEKGIEHANDIEVMALLLDLRELLLSCISQQFENALRRLLAVNHWNLAALNQRLKVRTFVNCLKVLIFRLYDIFELNFLLKRKRVMVDSLNFDVAKHRLSQVNFRPLDLFKVVHDGLGLNLSWFIKSLLDNLVVES